MLQTVLLAASLITMGQKIPDAAILGGGLRMIQPPESLNHNVDVTGIWRVL
jgi:hypothetical protein